MVRHNLTSIERQGLRQKINLADGHARQTLPAGTKLLISQEVKNLIEATVDIPGAECELYDALSSRLGMSFAVGQRFILYSASLSVDLLAKLLRARGRSVHMVTPAFDNLASLLLLNGLTVVPIQESLVYPNVDFPALDALEVESLFLVLPNNPTGALLCYEEILKLFEWAAVRSVVIVLDMSFRLLVDDLHRDLIEDAEMIGATVAAVDDTGKTISFYDSKLSVLTCSKDLVAEIRYIHEQILLNSSWLDMKLLAFLIRPSAQLPDELERARGIVHHNRQVVHGALAAQGIEPWMRPDETLSVEWIYLGERAVPTLRQCELNGLQLLPGSLFDWHGANAGATSGFVRLALMRDEKVVEAGCEILQSVLGSVADV